MRTLAALFCFASIGLFVVAQSATLGFFCLGIGLCCDLLSETFDRQ